MITGITFASSALYEGQSTTFEVVLDKAVVADTVINLQPQTGQSTEFEAVQVLAGTVMNLQPQASVTAPGNTRCNLGPKTARCF